MRIEAIKFYEGWNITGNRQSLKIRALETTKEELLAAAETYIRVCRSLGLRERVLEISETEGEVALWVSYSQEEASRFIWQSIIEGRTSPEEIAQGARCLMESSSISALLERAESLEIPAISMGNGMYRLGYGKESRLTAGEVEGLDIARIPVFAVTGTNGKTTTSRLLYHMLMKMGFNVGLTNTGSIMVGDERIETGDTTGFLSARRILADDRVEAAVLETARGGILNNGLGFEHIDAAIVTSLSADHLGLSGVNSLEDLMRVKAVVLRGVRRGGKWILRAKGEIIGEALKNLDGQSLREKALLFELDRNTLVEEHISKGGEAMYLEGDFIVHHRAGTLEKIANVKELPFTHYGISKGNILNSMAALLALEGIGVEMEELVEIMKTIPCDLIHNPGRQNLLDLGGVRVLIDYGHNAESYEVVYSIVRALKPQRVTSIITAPGDRQDSHIEELGYIAGAQSDFIVIREQRDQRGSELGRVANLMTRGALRAGREAEDIDYIYDPGEDLMFALEKAGQGDVEVIFTEYLEPVIKSLNEYLGESRPKIPFPKLSI